MAIVVYIAHHYPIIFKHTKPASLVVRSWTWYLITGHNMLQLLYIHTHTMPIDSKDTDILHNVCTYVHTYMYYVYYVYLV